MAKKIINFNKNEFWLFPENSKAEDNWKFIKEIYKREHEEKRTDLKNG